MFASRPRRCWSVGPLGASVGRASGRGQVTPGGGGGGRDLGTALGAPGSWNPPSRDRAPRRLWGGGRGGEQWKGTAPGGSGGKGSEVRRPASCRCRQCRGAGFGPAAGVRAECPAHPPSPSRGDLGLPCPSGGWWTRVQSDVSSLATRLGDGGSRHLGGGALCFCKPCALPASWTPVPGLQPLPASHRAGGCVG